jgi:hypothetical protein
MTPSQSWPRRNTLVYGRPGEGRRRSNRKSLWLLPVKSFSCRSDGWRGGEGPEGPGQGGGGGGQEEGGGAAEHPSLFGPSAAAPRPQGQGYRAAGQWEIIWSVKDLQYLQVVAQLARSSALPSSSRNFHHGRLYNYVLPAPRVSWSSPLPPRGPGGPAWLTATELQDRPDVLQDKVLYVPVYSCIQL